MKQYQDTELKRLEDFAAATVRSLTLPEIRPEPEGVHFEQNDISHPIDHDLHTFLRDRLRKTGLPVLSEEDFKETSHVELPCDKYWLVDPVDGTYNLWRGLDFVATSVALMDGPNPIYGVVKSLKTGTLYQGGVTTPATVDGGAISVAKTSRLNEAVLATGFPVRTAKNQFALGLKERALSDVGKVRMFGSAALSLCLLAEGKIDIYWERGIFLWDVAAGLAVAAAAGANVSVKRTPNSLRCEVLAESPSLPGNRTV